MLSAGVSSTFTLCLGRVNRTLVLGLGLRRLSGSATLASRPAAEWAAMRTDRLSSRSHAEAQVISRNGR